MLNTEPLNKSYDEKGVYAGQKPLTVLPRPWRSNGGEDGEYDYPRQSL